MAGRVGLLLCFGYKLKANLQWWVIFNFFVIDIPYFTDGLSFWL